MTTYNQAILNLAQAALADLNASVTSHKTPKTAIAHSHFLCNWMVKSSKNKRFSKLVADDLKAWIRAARSQGAGAALPDTMRRINYWYSKCTDKKQLGNQLHQLLTALETQGWMVISDTHLQEKLKLESDGQSSILVCAEQYSKHIQDGELIKPIQLYVRAPQQDLLELSSQYDLLLSQPNKKSSLIKHHVTYILYPNNQHPQLTLLPEVTPTVDG
ncbi:DUF2913 family protein [Shewanella gelidii]|uniref:DUF2913 domain-containing protein n=1 Tax=Shewanella gelidii TaxID=1642821 RepID=A0A917JJ03_9GAMM|nr:DUF2913 family protein [Shewanella gelidii]MCL1096784.1 DUF2913 family protein [Shewanella gelidii]GGI70128.1 DUF2913 domain-containing protein [Shewanella gelidii]